MSEWFEDHSRHPLESHKQYENSQYSCCLTACTEYVILHIPEDRSPPPDYLEER